MKSVLNQVTITEFYPDGEVLPTKDRPAVRVIEYQTPKTDDDPFVYPLYEIYTAYMEIYECGDAENGPDVGYDTTPWELFEHGMGGVPIGKETWESAIEFIHRRLEDAEIEDQMRKGMIENA